MPVVIRVSDEAQALIPHVQVARAIGFIKAKARQLTPIMWREAECRRNNIPNRTFYYAMPGSAIGTIELKTNPREQSWHARIIGGAQPAGILAFPRNVENVNGWIAPFDPPTPGTPNVGNEDEKRAIYRHTSDPALTVIKGQDFREFEGANLVDWRSGTLIDPDTGENFIEVLHWHAANRYFPKVARHDLTDDTFAQYESHFYDESGTVKVEGPGDDIKGVALRNLQQVDIDDNSLEEYVVITGRIVEPTGYRVHVRGRQAAKDDDPLFPWVEIGNTTDLTGILGTFGPGPWPGGWNTPIHFNRLGTRAVKVEFARLDAPVLQSATPHTLEIFVDGATVTQALTNVGTPQTITETKFKSTNAPGGGVSQVTARTESLRIQLASPIAADYKIGSDTELGLITTDYQVDGLEDVFFDFLSTDTSPPFGQVHQDVTTTTERITRQTISFNMDGGQAVFTLGPFALGIQQEDMNYVSDVDVDRNVFTPLALDPSLVIAGTFTYSDNLTADEHGSVNNSQHLEVQFADIRYGTMVVKERQYVPEAINFNVDIHVPAGVFVAIPAGQLNIPDGANPQVVGPVIAVTDTTNTIAVVEVFTSFVPIYAVWGSRNRFINKTHIRGRSLDETFELEDEFYATAKFSGSPGIQLPEVYEGIFGQGFIPAGPDVDPEETTVVELGTGNATILNSAFLWASPELQSNVGVNDRTGRLFYSVGLFDIDRQSGSKGPGAGFLEPRPDYDHASFTAYGTKDPVADTGMPPNEQNGPQGDETNTTRPLFGPIIMIQNKTIPIP